MNQNEAKQILLLYRPGTDERDPQVAEALALAKQDPDLNRWLWELSAQQKSLREKFRQIAPPAGLKEQIISEERSRSRMSSRRWMALAAVAIIILLASVLVWRQARPRENDFVNYRAQMVRVALTAYSMDLETNNMASVRAYLAQQHAPADYVLPSGLNRAELTGCAIEPWEDAKAAMVCFRTGRPLRQGDNSDLWLFVIDVRLVGRPPKASNLQLAKIKNLMTATWTEGNKIYILGVAGDESTIRKYL